MRGPTSAARTGRTGSPSGCDLYRSYAGELIEHGHAYHCFCSPEQLEADRRAAMDAGRPPQYAGRCRDLSRDEAAGAPRGRRAGRRAVPRAAGSRRGVPRPRARHGRSSSTEVIGDPVLVRSDGNPAYNFAVVDRRCADGDHARGARRGPHLEHAAAGAALRGARLRAAACSRTWRSCSGPITRRCRSGTARRRWPSSANRGYLPEALVNYLALHRLVARRRRRGAAGCTNSRAGSRSRTSATAPACSTMRSSPG